MSLVGLPRRHGARWIRRAPSPVSLRSFTARTPSLAAGVRADLVLLVPMIDDSAAAQRWFQRANLDVEPEELAAVYDALDRPTEVVALLADGRHQPRSTA